MKISQQELLHLKMQAILRENQFGDDQLKYMGEKEDVLGEMQHWYLINNEHLVPLSDIMDMEQVDEDGAGV